MDDMTRFEGRFEERLRAFASTGVQSVDSAAVARAAAVGHPKTAATKPDQRRRLVEIRRPRSISRTTFAAAAVVAILVVGGALFVVAGGPSPTPSADPSPSLPVVVAPVRPQRPSARRPRPLPAFDRVWIPPGRWPRPRATPRCGSSMAGCSLWAVQRRGRTRPQSCTTPSSGTWSATGNMLGPGAGFPATLLRDGRVLVGGFDDDGAERIAAAELFDPDSGTWSATGKKATS